MLRENTFPHHFATPSFQASLLCPLVIATGYTQSLRRGNDQHKEQGSLQSVHGGVCCSFLLTLTLCSSVAFHGLQFLSGAFAVVQVLHRHQGVPALVPWSNSPSLTLLFPLLFLNFLSFFLSIWWIFFPFLNTFSEEAPPLRGSAVPCDGSARMGWNWLCLARCSLNLSSQRLPCSPLLPVPGHQHPVKWEKLKNRTAKMNKRIALPCVNRLKRLDFSLEKTRLKIDTNNV